MFLRDLFRHSKLLFFLFAGFISAFIFLNLKWGMVASPVYQYGMFSKPFYLNDPFTVYHFRLGDEHLSLASLHFTERDLLLVSLERFQRVKEGNQAVYQTMSRFLPLPASISEVPSAEIFNRWYRKKAEAIFGRNTDDLMVYSVIKEGVVTDTNTRKQIFPCVD